MMYDLDYSAAKMRYNDLLQEAEDYRLHKSLPRLHPNRWEMLMHWLGNSFIRLGQWLQGWKGADIRPLLTNLER